MPPDQDDRCTLRCDGHARVRESPVPPGEPLYEEPIGGCLPPQRVLHEHRSNLFAGALLHAPIHDTNFGALTELPPTPPPEAQVRLPPRRVVHLPLRAQLHEAPQQ